MHPRKTIANSSFAIISTTVRNIKKIYQIFALKFVPARQLSFGISDFPEFSGTRWSLIVVFETAIIVNNTANMRHKVKLGENRKYCMKIHWKLLLLILAFVEIISIKQNCKSFSVIFTISVRI